MLDIFLHFIRITYFLILELAQLPKFMLIKAIIEQFTSKIKLPMNIKSDLVSFEHGCKDLDVIDNICKHW